MTHAHHAVLTLLSCGLWLPIWLLCAILGLVVVVPNSCTFCGAAFRKVREEVEINGKTEHLCAECSQQLRRRISKDAVRRKLGGSSRDDD